jgi:thiamine transporter
LTKNFSRIQKWAEIGIMTALAFALSLVSFFQFPFGGKISLEMLPIFVIARFRGFKAGFATGFLFGILDLLREPLVVHPIQFLLDYPLAFTSLGLAGVFPKQSFWDVPACLAAGCVRFLCHFLSGVIFFSSYVPKGETVLFYSFSYNFFYIAPSLGLCLFLIMPILSALRRAFPEKNTSAVLPF